MGAEMSDKKQGSETEGKIAYKSERLDDEDTKGQQQKWGDGIHEDPGTGKPKGEGDPSDDDDTAGQSQSEKFAQEKFASEKYASEKYAQEKFSHEK